MSEGDAEAAEGGPEPETAPEPTVRRPTGPPNRLARNVVIGMVGVLFVAANLANTVLVSFVDKYPVLLIAFNSSNRNLVLASGELNAWTFYLVGFFRLLISDPLFYLLGRWYGDAGIRWMESRSPMYGRMLRTAEGWFKKASYPVIAIAPNNYFCLFAGASGMPVAGFLIANIVGTAVRLFLLRSFGNLFDGPLEAVRDFIADNRLPVFVIGMVALVLSIWADRRSGGEVDGVLELDREVAAEREERQEGGS
jgi:membrane protein DedA with SNARE-associated domain